MANRIIESIDFESDVKNFKHPFKKMCKLYGKEFIKLLQIMWQSNDYVLSEEEFCKLNELDKSFFDKVIRGNN